MITITDIFSETHQTKLDCGLTIIDDGAGIAVVDTDELQQWIEDHGDDNPSYDDFCDGVTSIACSHNDRANAIVEAVRIDRGDEAAEEVASSLDAFDCYVDDDDA